MISTALRVAQYSSVLLVCMLLTAAVHAQDANEPPAPLENTGPTPAADQNDEFPFNTTDDSATSGAVETGSDSGDAESENGVMNEYAPMDRDQLNGEEQPSSYLEELVGKYSDPAFDRYVDFTHLQIAFAGNEVSALVDVILALGHAENILKRTHSSGVTADDLVRRLAPFLARTNEKQFSRLQRGAKDLGKNWEEQLLAAQEFASKERAQAPVVSLESISNSKMAVYSAYADALRIAEMANNQEDIKALLAELAKAEGLSEAEREFLSVSRSAEQSVSEDDPAGELLREFSSASRESSNRNEVRANLSRGWSVIWGKNFTEADWARGLKAIAESIASENPGPFLAWFSSVIDENFAKIQANLGNVTRRDLERWIVQSLRQKQIIRYGGLRIQAGFATYNRWQRTVHHEPRPKWKWIYGPFGSKTKIPDGVEMHKVEHKIPLPNWHQFYIRYQLVSSGGGGSGGAREYKIWIENPTHNRVYYKLNGDSFHVEPNKTKWHSRRGNSSFNVEFDQSFSSGYQRRGYSLTAGSRNYFSIQGNGLDLYRR